MTSVLETADRTARATLAAAVDTYETAARAVCELEWALARAAGFEPLSSLAQTCADLTRDLAAVQLSTTRWILDL